ncbi:hypothetical protein D3C86_1653010 [compost metagenome]
MRRGRALRRHARARAGSGQDWLHRPALRRRRAVRQERAVRHPDGRGRDQRAGPGRQRQEGQAGSGGAGRQVRAGRGRHQRPPPGAAAQDPGRLRAALGRHLRAAGLQRAGEVPGHGLFERAAHHRRRQQADHPHPAGLYRLYRTVHQGADEALRQERGASSAP